MRKGTIFSAFLVAVAAVGFAISSDQIGERGPTAAQPQFRHEGDTRTFFNVACPYSTWTEVVAAGVTSRSVLFVGIAANTGGVCLSSSTASATSCADTVAAVHLYPGASFTDFGTGNWYCRSRSTSTDRVAGYRAYHSAD
jgi:hypothetical protein